MNRRVKILALTGSHVALFVIGAVLLAGYRTQAQFLTAAKNPLFRIAATLSIFPPDKAATASFDAALTTLPSTFTPPTADVIRFVGLLKQNRITEARNTCVALSWPHCDQQALVDMRKALHP